MQLLHSEQGWRKQGLVQSFDVLSGKCNGHVSQSKVELPGTHVRRANVLQAAERRHGDGPSHSKDGKTVRKTPIHPFLALEFHWLQSRIQRNKAAGQKNLNEVFSGGEAGHHAVPPCPAVGEGDVEALAGQQVSVRRQDVLDAASQLQHEVISRRHRTELLFSDIAGKSVSKFYTMLEEKRRQQWDGLGKKFDLETTSVPQTEALFELD